VANPQNPTRIASNSRKTDQTQRQTEAILENGAARANITASNNPTWGISDEAEMVVCALDQ
jgi:hypothetical protein